MSNNIKTLRLAAELTQKQLAEIAGMPYQTVQKYENGERPIVGMTLGTAVKFAAALGVQVEDLTRSEA